MDDIEYIKTIVLANNDMLKSIIHYINMKEINSNQENSDDFKRNILANLISNSMIFKK